jgi:4-amino-4-deoxy-L-arabinose transferase-like glycosyltransferase
MTVDRAASIEPSTPPRSTISLRGRGGLIVLLAIVLACLLPFIDKPVHIDDPAYIWMAQQITHRPWDFYGFEGNYYGGVTRADVFTKNPPLMSYYLAAAASVLGWSERALHTAMFLPALLSVAGGYELGRRFSTTAAGALLAGMIAAFSPVFMVSAMTITCDVTMQALLIWATIVWIDGVRRGSQRRLAIGATLILAATLAKYFAACLIPLLGIYALLYWRGPRRGLLWFTIPIAGLLGFELYTHHLYGGGAFTSAAAYATSARQTGGRTPVRLLSGLSFVGGCMMTAAPIGAAAVWHALRRRGWSGWIYAAVAAALFVGLVLWQTPEMARLAGIPSLPPLVMRQLIFFALSGAAVLWLAFDELRSGGGSADSVLLVLAVFGTFAFIIAFNWTVSARNVLPMSPFIAVLAVRWIERARRDDDAKTPTPARAPARGWYVAITALLPVAVLVLRADVRLAESEHDAAMMVHDFAIAAGSPKVWFQGHWGFQYYMQQWGAQPVDVNSSHCAKGDLLVLAWDNSNISYIPARAVRKLARVAPLPTYRIASLHLQMMAGFHSDLYGPLPFAIGDGRAERFDIYVLEHNLIFGENASGVPTTEPSAASLPQMNGDGRR